MTWNHIEHLLGRAAGQSLRTFFAEPGDFLFGPWKPDSLPPSLANQVAILRSLSHRPGPSVQNPSDLFAEVAYLGAKSQETVVVLYLDGLNRVLGGEEMFRGTSSGVTVSAREVFKGALLKEASGIFMAHNHPTGVVRPSREDDQCTRQIWRGGQLLGIPLVDHLIVGKGEYFSYRAVGRIIRSGQKRTSNARQAPSPSGRCPSSQSTLRRPRGCKRWARNH